MSQQAVAPSVDEQVLHGLEDHVRTRLEVLDCTPAAAIYHSFDDHFALGTAILEAIEETIGTDRTFEDGVRQSWSPTRDEELAFVRFLTEYESAFWTIRCDVLRSHADVVHNLPTESIRDFIATLDREIRREFLVRIQTMRSLTQE